MLGQTAPPPPNYEELWALRDINLAVHRGEALALIGSAASAATFWPSSASSCACVWSNR